MIKKILSICSITLLLFTGAHAQPNPNAVLNPPEYAVKAWILMDYETGAVLAEHNSQQQFEPASITKVMTSYLIAEALENGVIRNDDLVRISHKARQQPGSRMFVEENSNVSVENLVKGLVIQSGNDAAVALAEHLAHSEESFVVKMNEKAAEMGLTQTHFENTSGLPHPAHLTTAYDLAVLSRALIKNYPEHYKIYSQRSFTWNNITQNNRNTLLWEDSSVDGIKTGHTNSAGYSLASSAIRNDFRVIAVVLGADSENYRQRVSRELLNFAFNNFDRKKIYSANEKIEELKIRRGVTETIAVGVKDEIVATLPRIQYDNLKAQIRMEDPIIAPIQKGEEIAKLEFYLGDHKLYSFPVVALEDVEQTGIFQRIWNDFLHKLKNKYAKFRAAL